MSRILVDWSVYREARDTLPLDYTELVFHLQRNRAYLNKNLLDSPLANDIIKHSTRSPVSMDRLTATVFVLTVLGIAIAFARYVFLPITGEEFIWSFVSVVLLSGLSFKHIEVMKLKQQQRLNIVAILKQIAQ